MFHFRSKKSVLLLKKNRQYQNKAFFQRDLRNILGLLRYERQPGMQISFLDFSIKAIGRELEAEVIAGFLCRDENESESEHLYEILLANKYGSTWMVRGADLSDYHVITRPWQRERLLHAVNSVFRYGFLQGEGFYNGTLYQELGLVVIENGRHHLTAAQIKGTASADLQVVSLEPCFSKLTTDGAFWFCAGECEAVGDYRMALLYELARQRYRLCQGQLFPEPSHNCTNSHELNLDMPQNVMDLLQEKNDDLQYLRNENRILSCHLLRLLQQLEDADIPDPILNFK